MTTSPPRKCPICGKPRSAEHTPFCSTRCRDRDLVRWLDEGYVIAGQPNDPEGPQSPDEDDPDGA